jgi:hypothetical protein
MKPKEAAPSAARQVSPSNSFYPTTHKAGMTWKLFSNAEAQAEL